MQEIEKQRKRLEKILKILKGGDVAFAKYLVDLEDRVDEEVPSVKEIILRLKGDKGDSYVITEKDKKEILDILIDRINEKLSTVKNGEDYVLTDKDKKEIAKSITVPVVEKIIEKVERIIEKPINIENPYVLKLEAIIESIKSNKLVSGEVIRDMLELLPKGEKLSIQAIEDLAEIIEELRKLIRDIPIGRVGGGGLSTLALNSHFIDDETPSGTINGSNKIFTLNKTPATGSLKVYRGGARQRVTEDYTFSGKTITFTIAPVVGEVILVDYRY